MSAVEGKTFLLLQLNRRPQVKAHRGPYCHPVLGKFEFSTLFWLLSHPEGGSKFQWPASVWAPAECKIGVLVLL